MKDFKLTDLKVKQYLLMYGLDLLCVIVLERVPGIDGEQWAIRRDGSALSKVCDEYGYFHFSPEPMPSSRTDEFFAEYRWDTAEEAFEFWKKNRQHIIATNQEYRDWNMLIDNMGVEYE